MRLPAGSPLFVASLFRHPSQLSKSREPLRLRFVTCKNHYVNNVQGFESTRCSRQSFFQYAYSGSWLANRQAFGLYSPFRKRVRLSCRDLLVTVHVARKSKVAMIVVKRVHKFTGLKSPRQAAHQSSLDLRPREIHHHVSYCHQRHLVHFLDSRMHSEQ